MADRSVTPSLAATYSLLDRRRQWNRTTMTPRMPTLAAVWFIAATLVALAGSPAHARYLPTRARVDGIDRLRELLRDVSVI